MGIVAAYRGRFKSSTVGFGFVHVLTLSLVSQKHSWT